MRSMTAAVLTLILLVVLPVVAGDATRYGEGITLDTAVAVEALLTSPDDYLGKKVRVDGVITGVCEKRGCWMQLTDPESGQGVRVKVEDGVIVIPYESMGHRAAAQGVFEAVKLTPEQVAARAAAAQKQAAGEAAATGEPCEKPGEPAVKAGCDAPVKDDTIYLIRGTGAVIQS